MRTVESVLTFHRQWYGGGISSLVLFGELRLLSSCQQDSGSVTEVNSFNDEASEGTHPTTKPRLRKDAIYTRRSKPDTRKLGQRSTKAEMLLFLFYLSCFYFLFQLCCVLVVSLSSFGFRIITQSHHCNFKCSFFVFGAAFLFLLFLRVLITFSG